ncbi:MAG: hypothetical protein JSR82_16915 [Verrucomicrobia bacterium]|nr:hypothetical protein [Verrucomicrobiota bacterium]
MHFIRGSLVLLLLVALSTQSASARYITAPDVDELARTADLVAIVEPLANEKCGDRFPGKENSELEHFVGVNTRFRVVAVLKGRAGAEEIRVLHFRYARPGEYVRKEPAPGEPERVLVNGAAFIEFGLPKENQASQRWLAFLKRRKDGRFEPKGPQYDSAYSFRRLEVSHGR